MIDCQVDTLGSKRALKKEFRKGVLKPLMESQLAAMIIRHESKRSKERSQLTEQGKAALRGFVK